MKNFRVIELTQGFVAIIDAEDFRRVNRYSWHVHKAKGRKVKAPEPYARATIGGKKVYLHRFIMNAPDDKHVDHRNKQTLDCRKLNLEVTTPEENYQRRHYVERARTRVATEAC